MEVRHVDRSTLEGLQSSELTILTSNQQGWAKRRKKFANEKVLTIKGGFAMAQTTQSHLKKWVPVPEAGRLL